MSLLQKQEQLFKITLYYMEKEIDGGICNIILDDKKADKMLADEKQKDKVLVLNTYWKGLSWQDSNNITKASEKRGAEALPGEVDLYRARDLRVKTLLKKWDLLDDDGKNAPVTSENINRLPVEVVLALLKKYDDITTLTDDELKN